MSAWHMQDTGFNPLYHTKGGREIIVKSLEEEGSKVDPHIWIYRLALGESNEDEHDWHAAWYKHIHWLLFVPCSLS